MKTEATATTTARNSSTQTDSKHETTALRHAGRTGPTTTTRNAVNDIRVAIRSTGLHTLQSGNTGCIFRGSFLLFLLLWIGITRVTLSCTTKLGTASWHVKVCLETGCPTLGIRITMTTIIIGVTFWALLPSLTVGLQNRHWWSIGSTISFGTVRTRMQQMSSSRLGAPSTGTVDILGRLVGGSLDRNFVILDARSHCSFHNCEFCGVQELAFLGIVSCGSSLFPVKYGVYQKRGGGSISLENCNFVCGGKIEVHHFKRNIFRSTSGTVNFLESHRVTLRQVD